MLNLISPEETIRVPEDTGIDIFIHSSLEVTLQNPRVPVRIKFSTMPKPMKKSAREQSPASEDYNSTDTAEASDSDHNQDPDVSFCPVVPPNQVPTMFMPYIEGPKMNWTVNDSLYHRFLKW